MLCDGLSILIEVLASIAEQERLTIKQRQAEGIAVAKEKGKHLGRPKAEFPPDWNEIYHAWKRGELTAVAAMNELNMELCQYLGHKKLNFSPSITYAERIISYADRASSSTCCGVL